MGGDGGSLPTRSDLVKEKVKEEVANPHELTRSRWTTCRLSGHLLGPDVATCAFGMLYNREYVVLYMGDVRAGKRTVIPAFEHLKAMKDLLRLQPRLIEGAAAADAFPRWHCPITGLEANGTHPFSAMRPCGCVVSQRALKEVPSSRCVSCGVKLTNQPIPLLSAPQALAPLPELSQSTSLIATNNAKPTNGMEKMQMYQSPLEIMREQRAKDRLEKERVEDEKKRKQTEQTRLLATRKVGALLDASAGKHTPAAATILSSPLAGKRKDVFAVESLLSRPSPSASSRPSKRPSLHANRVEHSSSAVRTGHLSSLFSASLRPPA